MNQGWVELVLFLNSKYITWFPTFYAPKAMAMFFFSFLKCLNVNIVQIFPLYFAIFMLCLNTRVLVPIFFSFLLSLFISIFFKPLFYYFEPIPVFFYLWSLNFCFSFGFWGSSEVDRIKVLLLCRDSDWCSTCCGRLRPPQ